MSSRSSMWQCVCDARVLRQSLMLGVRRTCGGCTQLSTANSKAGVIVQEDALDCLLNCMRFKGRLRWSGLSVSLS